MVAVIIVVNKSLVICEDLTSLLEEKTEYSLHLRQDFMCNSSKYQQDINSARIYCIHKTASLKSRTQ